MIQRSLRRRAALLALTCGLPLTACVTTGSGTHHDPTLPEDDKVGTKQEGTAPAGQEGAQVALPGTPPGSGPQPSATEPARKIEEPPPPSVDEQLAFVRRQSAPAAPFTEADRAFVVALPSSPPPGSVAEAALALGLMRTVLNPLGGEVATFSEADLAKQPPAAPGAPPAAPATAAPKGQTPTLEQLCKERHLNLPDAMSENPLLGTAGVAKQVMAALNVGENSAEFKNELTTALKKQANLWNEVSGGSLAPAAAPTGAVPPPTGPAPAPAAAAASDDAPPNPADLVGGDAVLAEAQALADRGTYQAAIKKAGSVAEGNPLRPQAQDKVKEFSNLAVQELRKKAAAAFQTAMPLSDPKTRAEYLRQAKGFLEEAIKDFPDATQLPTVRDNLRVISRDLERLESEGGQKKGG